MVKGGQKEEKGKLEEIREIRRKIEEGNKKRKSKKGNRKIRNQSQTEHFVVCGNEAG